MMLTMKTFYRALLISALILGAGCGGNGGDDDYGQDSGTDDNDSTDDTEDDNDDDDTSDDDDDTSDHDTDTNDDDTDTDDDDTDTDDDDEFVCLINPNCNEQYCDQILIPGGERTMGSEAAPGDDLGVYFGTGDARPPHAVYLDTFCIDKYEVTYERYAACVVAGVCDPNGHTWNDGAFIEGHPVVINHYPRKCEGSDGDVSLCWQHPVNCRDNEASAIYCEWVGRKLCTEAQWERAANGPGPVRKYPWGDDEPTESTANLPPWSNRITAEVQAFPDDISPEGVRGLGGNVVEWVYNYYGSYEPAPDGETLDNPEGPTTGEFRSARGGCYFEGKFSNVHRHTFDPEFDWG
ncbi:MAG: formylglycine-generating enzyme family protein [Proteobacteria bacterium]|nr:formylglycine-generating enzyme family protein [Pseudomonadota bacterium]